MTDQLTVPRSVTLGGAASLGALIASEAVHPEGSRVLSVNQRPWQIIHESPDATLCLEAWRKEGPHSEVGLAAAVNARWLVAFGEAPLHEVYWGPKNTGEGFISELQHSLEVGSFEVITELRSEDEDVRLQHEERANVLSRLAQADCSVGACDQCGSIFEQLHSNQYARPDWEPVRRGPLVCYRRWGWLIRRSQEAKT